MLANSMMAMESAGPIILGFHFDIFLMIASGVFYVLCALFVWNSYRKEKNELVGALLAFLVYQAMSMMLMGLGMSTMNMMYMNLASLAILIGSVYMLKFPFSSFSKGTRNAVFMISLIAVLAAFLWFMQTVELQTKLEHAILWYDLVVNGVVVGGFMIMLGLRTAERWLKVKALGGGTGVVACCVAANTAMIGGAFLTSSVFAFLAPVIILSSLVIAKSRS